MKEEHNDGAAARSNGCCRRKSRTRSRPAVNATDTPFDLVEVQETLASLPIKLYRKRQYRGRIPQARSYLQERDPDDVALAALASKLQILIWSNDRDFESLPIEIYPIAKLLKVLGL